VLRSKGETCIIAWMTKADADVYLSELTAMLIARGNARYGAALKRNRGSSRISLGTCRSWR